MNIKNELREKLEGLILGIISKDDVYKWALNVITENKENPIDKNYRRLFDYIFMDLIELNEPEWSDLTNEKIQYYLDCIVGKEEFNENKVMAFNKSTKKNRNSGT